MNSEKNVPWNAPLPWSEAQTRAEPPFGCQGLPEEWPLGFEDLIPWLGSDWGAQALRIRRSKHPLSMKLESHPEIGYAWAVLGEFWRLQEALRLSGGTRATVRIENIPLLPSDYVWNIQLHDVSPKGRRALGSYAAGLGLKRFFQANKSGPTIDIPAVFPQEWLGEGTKLLEKTFRGGLPPHATGYLLTVPSDAPLEDLVGEWFGPMYRSRWARRHLQAVLEPIPEVKPRRGLRF